MVFENEVVSLEMEDVGVQYSVLFLVESEKAAVSYQPLHIYPLFWKKWQHNLSINLYVKAVC